MMSKKSCLAAVSALIVLATGVTGCGDIKKENDEAQIETRYEVVTDELVYDGVIDFLYTLPNGGGDQMGGSTAFSECIEQWKSANPQITLYERCVESDVYSFVLEDLESSAELPDVFIVPASEFDRLSSRNELLDLTYELSRSKESLSGQREDAYLLPYTEDGNVYAIPAFVAASDTIVMYHSDEWEQAGYFEFPETIEELEQAWNSFKEDKTALISFGEAGSRRLADCFFSSFMYHYVGYDWYEDLLEGKADFTSDEMAEAMNDTVYLFRDSNLVSSPLEEMTSKEACDQFLSGETACLIGNYDDAQYVISHMEKDMLSDLYFAPLMWREIKADSEAETVSPYVAFSSRSLPYAIAINSQVKSDPEKYAACVNLVLYLTGENYARAAWDICKLRGYTVLSEMEYGGSPNAAGAEGAKARLFDFMYNYSRDCGALRDACYKELLDDLNERLRYLCLRQAEEGEDAISQETIQEELQIYYEIWCNR